MTETIKKRIAQINKGEIPKGYRKTKAGIMPEEWDCKIQAKHLFKNHTDKKHDGNLEILAATQDRGIVPRTQIDIDIKCSDEGISGYKKVEQGDFVISLRSFQGGIEYSSYDGIVSPAYTVLKRIKSISDDYYQNYFKTQDFIKRLNGAVYGIRDGKQIGYEDFGDLFIHNPPLEEQEKIAKILLQCDKIIELKQERLENEKLLLRKMLQTQLKPDAAWKKVILKDLANIVTGATPSTVCTEYWDGNIRWMSSGELKYKRIYDVEKRITEEGIKNSGTKLLPKYCVLIGLAGQGKTRGTVAMNYVELCTNQSIAAILPNDKYVPDFLYWSLENRYRELRRISSGDGSRGGLNLELIGGLIVRMPSLEKQRLVAEKLNMQERLIRLFEQEVIEWKKKKKALMQLLLRGIVRVNA